MDKAHVYVYVYVCSMDHRLYVLKCMHNSLLYARMHSGLDEQKTSESNGVQLTTTKAPTAVKITEGDSEKVQREKITTATDNSSVESKMPAPPSVKSKRFYFMPRLKD